MIDVANITLSHGDSVNFTCSSMGGPNNVIVWLKNATNVVCASNCSQVPTPVFNISGLLLVAISYSSFFFLKKH